MLDLDGSPLGHSTGPSLLPVSCRGWGEAGLAPSVTGGPFRPLIHLTLMRTLGRVGFPFTHEDRGSVKVLENEARSG